MLKPFIYTLLFIGCIGNSFAQDKSLSIENTLDIVRKYHPVIKQSFLQNEMAKNELRASKGVFDPSIQINNEEKTYDNKLYYNFATNFDNKYQIINTTERTLIIKCSQWPWNTFGG